MLKEKSARTYASEQSATVSYLDAFEDLRCILAREQQRDVTYQEATEIGDSLVSFYKTLAGTV